MIRTIKKKVDRAVMSIWLGFMTIYTLKEFYNYKTTPILMTNLVLYWISFIILIENELHSDGHNIFLFIQPFFFYVIFFSLHISDADRDEQPTSQSMFVNVDHLELFYSVWFLSIYPYYP